MSGDLPITSLTVSQAREKLYTLVRGASSGLRAYEIRLRGQEPVLLVNKAEVDSWLETLDVLSSPQEMKVIRQAKKTKRTLTHKELLGKI